MDIVATHQDALFELCIRHRVKALYLFGSATRDDFDPATSDLDFLVEFEPQPRRGFDDVYFKLHADLEALFNREIDLIERSTIEQAENPHRKRAILESLEPLYAAA